MRPAPFALALLTVAGGCTQGLNPAPTQTVNVPVSAPFTMGATADCGDGSCTGDRIPHMVQVSYAYNIDKGTVTNFQYARCVAFGECKPAADETFPIDTPAHQNAPATVAIAEAAEYCLFKADPTVDNAAFSRLPTEAEWELAANLSLLPYDVNTSEWVSDDYTDGPGCAEETPAWAICSLIGGGADCIGKICAGKSGADGCVKACGPNYMHGGDYCQPATATVVDPLHITAPHVPVQKSGTPPGSLCSGLAAYRSTGGTKGAFRCVSGAPAPAATLTARLPIPTSLITCGGTFTISLATNPPWFTQPGASAPRITLITYSPTTTMTPDLSTITTATVNQNVFTFTFPCDKTTMPSTAPTSAALIFNNVPLEDADFAFTSGGMSPVYCGVNFKTKLAGEVPMDAATLQMNCFN